MRLACVRRVYPFAAHAPLNAYDRARPYAVAAVFRRPGQRLASAFYADNHFGGRHAVGMPKVERKAFSGDLGVAFNETSPAQFVRWPGIAGCAAKMLLGHKCAAKVRSIDAAAAAALVPRLGFVGLTGRWAESVELLHAQLGLGPPLEAELRNAHAGPRQNGTAYDEAGLLDGFVDEDDELVYAAAVKTFDERRRLFSRAIADFPPAPRIKTPRRSLKPTTAYCCFNATGTANYTADYAREGPAPDR